MIQKVSYLYRKKPKSVLFRTYRLSYFKKAEKVFLISTTHGGETHAIRAGIKTIEEFKHHNVIQHNHLLGNTIIEKTKELIQENGLENYIEIIPCPWMVAFLFKNKQGEKCNGLKTFFLQEMIVRGILFQGIFVPSLSHGEKELNFFDIGSKPFNDRMLFIGKSVKCSGNFF